jgi:hypothetical protein
MIPRMIDPRAKSAAGSSIVIPGVMPKAGKIVDVDPSTMSVPPAFTNFCNSTSPSIPMPPRMSSDWSSAPRLGVAAVFWYGSGKAEVLAIPFTCEIAFPPTLRVDDDVVLRAQVAVLQLLVGKVRVGDPVGVERRAHPPFVLRALPGVHVADARHVQLVRGHRRRRRDRHGREAELTQRRLELAAIGGSG